MKKNKNHILSLINRTTHRFYDWIFVVGYTEDKSKEIIKEFRHKHPELIRIYYNSNKTVPMNIEYQCRCWTYIVRLDAHSEYAEVKDLSGTQLFLCSHQSLEFVIHNSG